MKNERIIITGGSGFLGKKLISRYYKDNEITVYSRDESKHYYLKKEFPDVNFIIGDIRNIDLLKRSCRNHTVGIFAASLKQIEAVDQNVEEAKGIIIDGAINSRLSAIENNFKSACFISSDKSRSATTLYGAMKFVAGESFIVNAEKNETRLSSIIYGNVLNSTGSIIPLMWETIRRNSELVLYSEDMTRFMITADEAIDTIELGLEFSGYNVIPSIKSFRIIDLFNIFKENFGLRYKIGKPRISEKIHEILFNEEESRRVKEYKNAYLMHYKETAKNKSEFKEFSSKDVTIGIEDLDTILKKYNYYNTIK
jgi:UDP-glucose 4-epimerase